MLYLPVKGHVRFSEEHLSPASLKEISVDVITAKTEVCLLYSGLSWTGPSPPSFFQFSWVYHYRWGRCWLSPQAPLLNTSLMAKQYESWEAIGNCLFLLRMPDISLPSSLRYLHFTPAVLIMIPWTRNRVRAVHILTRFLPKRLSWSHSLKDVTKSSVASVCTWVKNFFPERKINQLWYWRFTFVFSLCCFWISNTKLSPVGGVKKKRWGRNREWKGE